MYENLGGGATALHEVMHVVIMTPWDGTALQKTCMKNTIICWNGN